MGVVALPAEEGVASGNSWSTVAQREGLVVVVTRVSGDKARGPDPLEQNASIPNPSPTLNSKGAAGSWVPQAGPGLGTCLHPSLHQAAAVLHFGVQDPQGFV